MATKKAATRKVPTRKPSAIAVAGSVENRLDAALAWLRKNATTATLEAMPRYGLPTDHALGVSVADIQRLGKQLGTDHELAAALWDTAIYEARLLVAFVADPSKLTSGQMDRWCRDSDNWGVVDTLCFKLFDRSPLAWAKVDAWTAKRGEFQKRAGFALLACLAGHDRAAPDAWFVGGLRLIEQGATDERNFVKKGVSWALRRIGTRGPAMKKAAAAVAKKLAASDDPGSRSIGKDALRDFAKPARADRAAKA